MNSDLDTDFLSSVDSLSKELQVLGLDEKILTTSSYLACQSLLGTAWMLVQLIHCNSVTTAESTFHNERENKLRDELQSAQETMTNIIIACFATVLQTQLYQYKSRLEDKENQIKSVEHAARKLKVDVQKWHGTAESLTRKVKQLESKIERCHAFYRTELAAREAKCEKLQDHLRNKLGIARKITAPSDSLCVGISRVSVSSNNIRQKNEDNKLQVIEETVLSLKTDNQILVEENLLMRDNFARLHRQLDSVRKHGVDLLETLGIHNQIGDSANCDYSRSLFNLPISVVMEKLRKLGEDQIEEILNIFRGIEKKLSAAERSLLH